ncbi:MAG: metal-dependent transcriptional regulator [candidate division Zixibacteria bacterium]|nr:metal-dependent transcriptional regulator [candidate division Zixibacteria bacterium]
MNSNQDANELSLTAVQEDYLETIQRLEKSRPEDEVRITDIALALGTRLPTVTRTVQKLRALGLTSHPDRGAVQLTDRGRKLADEFVHRHNDLVTFFSETLGLPSGIAETDTCKIEHGISGSTAQKLHEYVEYLSRLPEETRAALDAFRKKPQRTRKEFKHIPETKPDGWRG